MAIHGFQLNSICNVELQLFLQLWWPPISRVHHFFSLSNLFSVCETFLWFNSYKNAETPVGANYWNYVEVLARNMFSSSINVFGTTPQDFQLSFHIYESNNEEIYDWKRWLSSSWNSQVCQSSGISILSVASQLERVVKNSFCGCSLRMRKAHLFWFWKKLPNLMRQAKTCTILLKSEKLFNQNHS